MLGERPTASVGGSGLDACASRHWPIASREPIVRGPDGDDCCLGNQDSINLFSEEAPAERVKVDQGQNGAWRGEFCGSWWRIN